MLFRRRNDGFEWKEYVRTTVLVRRKDRRRKLDDARLAAAESLKDAGRHGLKAGAAGAEKAGQAAVALAQRVGAGAAEGSAAAVAVAATGAAAARQSIARASAPLTARLMVGRVRWPLGLAAIGLGAACAARASQFGADSDAVAMGIAAALALLVWSWPVLFPHPDVQPAARYDENPATPGAASSITSRVHGTYRALTGQEPPASLVPVALAAVFAAGMMWIAWPSLLRLPSTLFTSGAAPQVSPPPASGETPFDLSGSARVTAPGQFRIGDTAVTLAAITALDTGQRCQRVSGSDWPCGREARQATEKLVRGRKVGCTFQGSGDPRPATCTAGGKDLAAELTRQGHSFADGLLFASYSVQEQQARETKSGLWAGTPERPDEWRARLWSEAEAAAPGGCAIKTRISGNDRRYLRPEDGDYARTVVRDARGEKWFCTEDEAKAAGFSRRED